MLNKIWKITAGLVIVSALILVLISWLGGKSPYDGGPGQSLGSSAENRVASMSGSSAQPAEVPQEVIPELVRLENVRWSQDPEGIRLIEFEFHSPNPQEAIIALYKHALEARGWQTEVYSKSLEAVQGDRKINYVFEEAENSTLIKGNYLEVVK